MPDPRVPVIAAVLHCSSERGGGVECLMWLICHSTTTYTHTHLNSTATTGWVVTAMYSAEWDSLL